MSSQIIEVDDFMAMVIRPQKRWMSWRVVVYLVVLLCYALGLWLSSSLVILSVGAVGLGFLLLIRHLRWVVLGAVFLLLGQLQNYQDQREIQDVISLREQRYHAVVLSHQGYSYEVQTLSPISVRAVVSPQKSSNKKEWEVGDEIYFTSTFNSTSNPKVVPNPYSFSWHALWASYGIKFYTNSTEICQSETSKILHWGASTRLFFYGVRDAMLRMFKERGISKDSYSVVSAMALGDRTSLSSSIKQQFSDTGTIHVLAVSGLHVGIIFAICSALLGFFSINRKISVVILLGGVWLFALLTGASPSALRASFMLSIYLSATAFSRQSNTWTSLWFSFIVLLCVCPAWVHSIGFWLSYVALYGILLFMPLWDSLLKIKNSAFRYCYNLIGLSVAASLSTLPLLIMFFHRVPIYSLVLSIPAVFMATLLLVLSVIFLCLFWMPCVSGIIVYLMNAVSTCLLSVVQKVSSWPFATIDQIYVSAFAAILLFLSISFLIVYWRDARYQTWLKMSLYMLSGFFIIETICLFRIAYSSSVIAWKLPYGQFAYGVRDGFDIHIYCSDSVANQRDVDTYVHTMHLNVPMIHYLNEPQLSYVIYRNSDCVIIPPITQKTYKRIVSNLPSLAEKNLMMGSPYGVSKIVEGNGRENIFVPYMSVSTQKRISEMTFIWNISKNGSFLSTRFLIGD